MKKKVLITVNPAVINGGKFTTMRKFVNTLSQHFDLLVIPIDGYRLKLGKAHAYRRAMGGTFEYSGLIKPEGDLWIVYSDGYYLDHRRFGFRLRRDYLRAQMDFHQKRLSAGSVSLMVNTPEAEARTLKSWLATLNFRKTKVIPTYLFTNIDEVYDLQKKRGPVVVKPIWGGASMQVELLADEKGVRQFDRRLKRFSDRDLSDYCFQEFRRGDEKRLWFAGGRCVAGQRFRGRGIAQAGWSNNYQFSVYDKSSRNGFNADLAVAERVCELSGISVGAIDFIGDQINEINGGGTVLTTLTAQRRLFVDARPAVIDYFLNLMKSL
jgi:hypothetical protein